MGRVVFHTLVILAAGSAGVAWWCRSPEPAESVFAPQLNLPEAAPLCPWRQPEQDLRLFFPEATGYQTETRVLSGHRLELERRLGRRPNPEEHTLQLEQVLRGEQRIGTVLVRRVKGEHGAIELVVAVNPDQTVRGLRIQRMREPEEVVRALQSPAWMGSLAGKSAPEPWQLGTDVPDLPEVARRSGEAVLDGIRCPLILLAVAGNQTPRAPHH